MQVVPSSFSLINNNAVLVPALSPYEATQFAAIELKENPYFKFDQAHTAYEVESLKSVWLTPGLATQGTLFYPGASLAFPAYLNIPIGSGVYQLVIWEKGSEGKK